MNWFWFALACLLFWGGADLFYKKGSEESDRYSHLKIAVWVGLVMGVCAIVLLPFSETGFDPATFLVNAVRYSPASLSYIFSMVIGYAGMRYLEISIVSPVQNASGAFSMIAMLIFFRVLPEEVSSELGDLNTGNLIGTALIALGLVTLGIVESRLARKEADALIRSDEQKRQARKYRFGALALLFPVLYCLFDTIGTAADGILLSEEAGLGLGEIDVLILYGLTFFLAGLAAWIFLALKTRKPYNPFAVKEVKTKGAAALLEEGGQIFYVFAMAKNPVLAAPMVASYCIVSVIFGRVFLKEKLKAAQYAAVFAVIVGIVILGVMEGVGEME